MQKRSTKALFYRVAGPLMRLNAAFYRHVRAPRKGNIRVHLGPGQKNYIAGWINVDANAFTARCDVWADLRHGIPFRPGTVTCFYSHHVIEHLPNLSRHFADVFHCLRRGGAYRLAGPNGDMAIAAFVRNSPEWFSDFPDSRRTLGGRFENFIFCRQEHLTILTESYLREILEDVGFEVAGPLLPAVESHHPGYFKECLAYEHEDDLMYPHTLVMEATKPV